MKPKNPLMPTARRQQYASLSVRLGGDGDPEILGIYEAKQGGDGLALLGHFTRQKEKRKKLMRSCKHCGPCLLRVSLQHQKLDEMWQQTRKWSAESQKMILNLGIQLDSLDIQL